ncbi:K+/H+ antiporter YhaU regulatory subunit KhtT [Acetoanaerobium pronyense]|uniref:K+/H+ antiporter YhaU regulatory subunit KhtT n=1 Tax=Acetoanaerobium pronyense TaxID=1482736 RepID=A0ABS4KGF8_9FIRM|nr:TrkA C-terminal domain-containing protein [Acetoanaerobium pronyense]MBP2026864.1 K+/H+ antiporter YhaU regulatory subunit KhtT [Acetoanaerobium pronyense]
MKGHKKAAYLSIALDIANKILQGEFKEDEKISGRSTLASMYNVSPETIRRAVSLLEEMDVVNSNRGSGIDILSKSSAEKFIEKNKSSEYISTIKDDIMNLMEQKKKIDEQIQESFEKITDYMERFKKDTPYTFIEIKINSRAKTLGKKIIDMRFWQSTGATIVAYRRDGNLIISPGPEYVFTEGDTIVVIGANNVYDKVYDFLYGE